MFTAEDEGEKQFKSLSTSLWHPPKMYFNIKLRFLKSDLQIYENKHDSKTSFFKRN